MPPDTVVERLRVRPDHQQDWMTSAVSFEATWWDFLLASSRALLRWRRKSKTPGLPAADLLLLRSAGPNSGGTYSGHSPWWVGPVRYSRRVARTLSATLRPIA